MEKTVVCRITSVQDISCRVIPHRCEVIVTTHFHDHLVLVSLKDLKVFHVRIGQPHGMAIVACTSIHMLNDNKLAAIFTFLELLFQPEHLLHSRLRAV